MITNAYFQEGTTPLLCGVVMLRGSLPLSLRTPKAGLSGAPHRLSAALVRGRTLWLIIVVLAFPILLHAQTDTFPASWAGTWQGKLDIYTPQGKAQTIPMELHILPIDTSDRHTWTIIYGAGDQAQKRPYELVTIDAAAGHYQIDEKNNILIDAYHFGDKLIQHFSVMGTMLVATNEVRDNEMIFEIYSGKDEAVTTSGDTTFESEDIPEVQAFPVANYQRAVLRRH